MTTTHVLWAIALGTLSAVSLPLGSLLGLWLRLPPRLIAILAAFGAGALFAALSVELVAPTAMLLGDSHSAAGAVAARHHLLALLLGAVCGGGVFVALDAVINAHGGHVRKTATMLAHVSKRHRQMLDA